MPSYREKPIVRKGRNAPYTKPTKVKYTFGTENFSTKSKIKEYIHGCLVNGSIGDMILDPVRGVMSELIKHHPSYSEWNVQNPAFRIGIDPQGNRVVTICDTGNKNGIFSYAKCIAACGK